MIKTKTGNINWWYSQCKTANGCVISISFPLKASADVYSKINKGLCINGIPTYTPESLILLSLELYVKKILTGTPAAMAKTKVSHVVSNVRENHCCLAVQVKDSAAAEKICCKIILKCLQATKLKPIYSLVNKQFGFKCNTDFNYAAKKLSDSFSSLTIGLVGSKKLEEPTLKVIAEASYPYLTIEKLENSEKTCKSETVEYPDCVVIKTSGWESGVVRSFITEKIKSNVVDVDKGLALINITESSWNNKKTNLTESIKVFSEKFVKKDIYICIFVYNMLSNGNLSSIECSAMMSGNMNAETIKKALSALSN